MRVRAPACAVVFGAALAAMVGMGPAGKPTCCSGEAKAACAAPDAYVLGHTVKAIDGNEVDLSRYKGKVVLIVNTASKCGLTPQYEGLQKLYEQKKDDGLVILGFPANDFRNQEPGTNEEIAEFCTSRYGVTFPMFEKIAVTGENKHPLYAQLAAQPEPIGGEPKWNFTKFLVDREGRVAARFEPKVTPDDPALVRKVEELLKAQPDAAGEKPRSAGA